jgi:hypothetical protein
MSLQFWVRDIHKAKLHSFISVFPMLLFLSNYLLLMLKVICLEDVTMPEIKKWYNDHVLCGNKSNLRKLSVQVGNHGRTSAYFMYTQFCKPLQGTVAPYGLHDCSFIFNLCIWCSQAITVSFHLPYNSLFTDHTITWHCIIRSTDSMIK